MKKLQIIFISIVLIIINYSCKQEPGQIIGVVMQKTYDKEFEYFQGIQPIGDYEVYLCRIDDGAIIDRVRTSYNGVYYFDRIDEEGNYQVFVYGDDTSKINLRIPYLSNIIEVKYDKVVKLDTIFIYKGIDIERGNSTIRGVVRVINYKNNGYEIKDIAMAQEVDVYLIYGSHKSYNIRTRTNYDGTFEFKNLILGNYTVYVYSEQEDALGNLTGATEKNAIKKTITIDKKDTYKIDTITIKIF